MMTSNFLKLTFFFFFLIFRVHFPMNKK